MPTPSLPKSLTDGTLDGSLSHLENDMRAMVDRQVALLNADIAQQVEVAMHLHGTDDITDPHTAAALRFLHERQVGDCDHLHLAYAAVLETAQAIADECRSGDFSRFPVLQGLLPYAVPASRARVTEAELGEWEKAHLAWARNEGQQMVNRWREEQRAAAIQITRFFNQHDLTVGMDTTLEPLEFTALTSIVQAQDHSTAA